MERSILGYAPPFMAARTESPKSAVFPLEGVDFRYDRDGQVAVFANGISGPTGYDTNQGNDWVTTDHV